MSKTLVIARNSLRRLFRDRSNLFFVFVLPMVLILVLGLVFGSGFTTRVVIVVPADDDRARALYNEIAGTTAFETLEADGEDVARRRLRRNDIDVVIVIPDGYTEQLDAGESVEIGYYATVSAGGIDVRAVVDAAIAEQGALVRAARFASGATGAPPESALAAAIAVGEQMPVVEAIVEGDVGPDASGGAVTKADQQ
jgi:ABC-2 type transport system permease protein